MPEQALRGPAHERTPLLNRQDGSTSDQPFVHRMLDIFKPSAEDPGWMRSAHYLVFGSYFSLLLVFVPLCLVADKLGWDAGLRFGFSFLAIVALAKLRGEATDQLGVKLGPTHGMLLNASFGNVVEIIVGVVALLRDETRIVQTFMLGSILGNILFALGCSFVAGGIRFSESGFQVTATQTSTSLMTLSCITLVIPAAYHSATHDENTEGLLVISRTAALLLLFVYASYVWFQLKSHVWLFNDTEDFETEVEEHAQMNAPAASLSLLVTMVLIVFCANALVASIEETAQVHHIPRTFIGLILLPIVGNAGEHVTSIAMAAQDNMGLTIGICVGSSIQIASFVVPLLVIVGWISGHTLTLFFEDFETIILFVSVILVSLLTNNGKSNYMEGLILLALYVIIGTASWVL